MNKSAIVVGLIAIVLSLFSYKYYFVENISGPMVSLICSWRFQKFAVPLCTFGFASVKALSTNMGNEDWKNAKSVYDFTVKNIKGDEVPLEKYKGHVLLIVNVASQCGLTKDNYKELVELDEKYRDEKGLRILAFPCNQFGGQEPGTNDEICTFVSKHGAKFDFFDKIDVNGDNAHPLWKYLKHKQGGTLGDSIKWNFTKFIVDKNGLPVDRFAPTTAPHKLVSSLEKYW